MRAFVLLSYEPLPRQPDRHSTGRTLGGSMKTRLSEICSVWMSVIILIFIGSASAEGVSFQINDPDEFHQIISTNAVLTTNATLTSWIEGPVWVPSDGGYLIFSDIGNNRLKKLVPPTTLTDYWVPPWNTKCNGNMLDLHERLISCQAGRAALQVAMLTNGVVTPLVTHYNYTNKFYSPNDLTMKSDGTIWFTDPGYDSGLPGPPQPGFQPSYAVYRFYETNGNATVLQVDSSLARPNGICLSPDETKLYVVDTGSTPHLIKVFDVTSSNTVTGGTTFTTGSKFDGIKCDVDGRVWAGAENGVAIYAPDGHLIGKILSSHRVANLCFGGPHYRTLYMVGQPYVTSIPVLTAGRPAIKRLSASVNENQIRLSWPSPSTGFTLQETRPLSPTSEWNNVTTSPAAVNGTNNVTVPAVDSASFYRLRLN